MPDELVRGLRLTFVFDDDPARTFSVDVPEMRGKHPGRAAGRRRGQESFTGIRQGRDGRWVQRNMVIDRDHDPPFKWHRVVDEESGQCIKDEAINLATGETVDLQRGERPNWLPQTVTYERSDGSSNTYVIAPPLGTRVPSEAIIHITSEQAGALATDLLGD